MNMYKIMDSTGNTVRILAERYEFVAGDTHLFIGKELIASFNRPASVIKIVEEK